MKEFVNSRLVAAIVISFGLPAMLFVAAFFSSKTIVSSVTEGIGTELAEMANGENKHTVKEIVSGFTSQIVGGVVEPFSDMATEEEQEKLKKLEMLDSIEVSNIRIVESSWGGGKVIGTIENNTDKYIEEIDLLFSAYDEAGNLLNVESKWISDVQAIRPNEAVNFGVRPTFLRAPRDEPFDPPAKLEVKVSEFSIIKLKNNSRPKTDSS